MAEIQDVFTACLSDYRRTHAIPLDQLKAAHAIINCRTSLLGGHMDVCDDCGFQRISYNSCRNRHCPKCQAFAKEEWVQAQNENLLNIGYFHAVFSIPDSLNVIVSQNQSVVYNIFFKAASETLLELAADKKYLGAKIGLTTVLHTWGQNLNFHPHIHCIVTGGGLTKDNKWINSKKKFFLPVKVMSRKFRGKFLHYLRQAELVFYGSVIEYQNPQLFDELVASLYRKEWIVFCKPPFKSSAKVVEYLGRYTHRVAISNNRIVNFEDGAVTFKWRDYADNNTTKLMTLSAVEFIRRFLMHILPSGFTKIRHYGILASRDKNARIALCKKLTNTSFFKGSSGLSALEKLKRMLGENFNLCPHCRKGHMVRVTPENLRSTVMIC